MLSTHSHLEFDQLLRLSEAELAQIDIAHVNLLCAVGLPGTEHINIPTCLDRLDQWANLVFDRTLHCPWFQQNPDKYDHSFNLFRIHVMVSVLQRECGVRYNLRCLPEDAKLYSQDVFIHGILQGTGGTCASLPVVYTAVGRRLGYPLKLVCTRSHLFIRWDDPHGECFNIEVSINQGFNNPPDDHYRTGRYFITPGQEREGYFLISLSPCQELSKFIGQKGHCWLDVEQYKKAVECFIRASQLHEQNVLPILCISNTLKQWQDKLTLLIPPNSPALEILWSQDRYPHLPRDLEQQVVSLEVLEGLLYNPLYQGWWEALRQSPEHRPEDIPTRVVVQLK